MRGREVSNRVPLGLVSACRARGIAIAPLFEGLSLSEASIRDPRGRCDWDEFTVFFDRIEEAVGGPAGTEQLSFEMVAAHRAMQIIGSLFISPQAVYLQAGERIARRLYHFDLGLRSEHVPPGEIHVEMSLPAELRPSLPFWHATIGCYRAYPKLIGLPPADVRAEIVHPHHCIFHVALPTSRTLLARAERLVTEPLWRLLGSLQGDGPTVADVQDAIEMAFDAPSLETMTQPTGQRLARHTDLGGLADDLQRVLREHLCSTGFGLYVREADGSERMVAPAVVGAAEACSLPLTIGDREVGRVVVDAACASSPLLGSILPWVAVAIERCRGDEPRARGPAEAPERCAELTAALRLTARQARVLELVAVGCSNKEISTALGCSVRTVEVHVGQLLKKAGVEGRSGLVARFWGGIEASEKRSSS